MWLRTEVSLMTAWREEPGCGAGLSAQLAVTSPARTNSALSFHTENLKRLLVPARTTGDFGVAYHGLLPGNGVGRVDVL